MTPDDGPRLVACPDCEGFREGEEGATPGSCETCGGTGLVEEEEVEKSL